MAIVAHQKQIEELRESFREKLLKAEKWPKQVPGTLSYSL